MGGIDEEGRDECKAPAGPRRRSLWDVASEAEDWDFEGEEEIVIGDDDVVPAPGSPQTASGPRWWALLILAGAVAAIVVWLAAGAW